VEMFLSVADASRLLDVTPQTVRLMVRRGVLSVSAKTVGGIQLFRREEVDRLVAQRRTGGYRTRLDIERQAHDGEPT
jgi:excisionase family DNA binding protein